MSPWVARIGKKPFVFYVESPKRFVAEREARRFVRRQWLIFSIFDSTIEIFDLARPPLEYSSSFTSSDSTRG